MYAEHEGIQDLERQLENMLKEPTEYGREIVQEMEQGCRRSRRITKKNTKDYEGRKSEEILQGRHSLSGYLSHLSRLVNQVDDVVCYPEAEMISDYLQKVKVAWDLYSEEYSIYILQDLTESELFRVKETYEKAQECYTKSATVASERLRHLRLIYGAKQTAPRRQRYDNDIISQYYYAEGSIKTMAGSISPSKKRELQRTAELKKMVAEQAEEIAKLEAEMEKRKIDIDLEKQKTVRKLRFEAQIAEKEANFWSEDDKLYPATGPGPSPYLRTPWTKEEQTDAWVMHGPEIPTYGTNQFHELDEKRKGRENFYEYEGDSPETHNTLRTRRGEENHAYGVGPRSTQHPEQIKSSSFVPSRDYNAIMLKLHMLQAMQPLRFRGNADDFPNFRNRLRDNLEDGLLTDGQKMEFLPKFVCGEAYEVVERASGCAYEDVVKILEERYGHPAAVAAACIEKLTVGPRLAHGDNKGLRNFAEQLEAASKKLQGEHEMEASTVSNLKLIVSRLPTYLAVKWGDTLYYIRDKGKSPKLKDLAAFVKRQAAIKNDPAFAAPTAVQNVESRVNRSRPTRVNYKGTSNQPTMQTATFVTDVKSKETHYSERKSENKGREERCLCCYGSHDASRCTQFANRDIQERWNIVKVNRLCHTCLRTGHRRAQCKSSDYCGCGSDIRHHKLLHNPPKPNTTITEKKTEEQKIERIQERKQSHTNDKGTSWDQRKTEQYATTFGTTEKTILLHVVPVRMLSPEGEAITTYGLLDNGSRATIISADAANKLCLTGQRETISVNTLLNKEEEEFEVVEFKMHPIDGKGEPIIVKEGLVSRRFNISESCLPSNIDKSLYSHLADIEIPEVEFPQVSVLIGKDVDEAHEIFEVRKSNQPTCKLQAQRGPLGWVITGTIDGKSHRKEVNLNFTDTESMKLREQIERFWKIDDYGTGQKNAQEQNTLSIEDLRAVKTLEETTVINEGHYETGLLWKQDDVKLPYNREQAGKRLSSLKNKFQRSPQFEEMYRDTMNSYIEKGYARKLSLNEASQSGPRTWYLPHFGVTNTNKPGKVRIVFDAAAEYQGTSLNKNLLQGPDCTNSLLGVLIRFRQEKVALVADIEGMFHQVKVRQEDQDSLRFLWWNGDLEDPPEEYAMTVHIFGARDSPCVANSILKKTADDNRDAFDPSTVSTVKNNFYVDDVLKSLPDADAAKRMTQQLSHLCSKGGFKLTKFMSNDRKVLAEVPEEKRATPFLDLKFEELPTERALGVRWNVEADTFSFKVADLEKPNTMRGVLSTISAVFDPLNFASPIILPAKRIMQELWKRKYKWDQHLEGEILQRWLTWKQNLALLEQVRVPRCYFTQTSEQLISLELHHFCDASESGYGTASYLRAKYQDGKIECSFVMGKSKNTPIKTLTIPRLELQAAVLATRIDRAVRKELELDIQQVTFWTDSMIVLNYIRNETRRFQTYVANRVTEIREHTSPNQWRHCPGKYNPADDASRGLDIYAYLENQRWLKGPDFLWETEGHWPEEKYEEVPTKNLEVKKEIYLTTTERESPMDALTNAYSNWIVLLRRIAWLVKFMEWIRYRSVKEKGITVEDLENAKLKVAGLVQRRAFPEEIKNLKSKTGVKGHSHIASLKPKLEEDGLLRVGGRLAKAPISQDAMHPIIMPRKDHVTTILVRYLHEKNGHCGHEELLALLREQFWVVQARVIIRQILTRCIKCKKQRGQKMHQEMGELPTVRLTPYEPPFTYTGVDYFGPLHVKRGRGRITEKRWGALFVCMNSRAIHLEVAKSLETDDFIMALTRFLNRRGHVKEIRSDNGTNFVGADREIKEALQEVNSQKIADELMERGCKWVFHPPGAPHMSGVWERLVKIVKRSLKAILGQDLVCEEVLQTVFTEAERIANARPLTRNPLSPNDEEPLTPNHFLNVRPTVNIPSEMIDEADKYSKKRWRQAQLLANHYWKRWLREYIPSLQERQKWRQPKRNLQVADLVLVADDNASRNKWPLARVTKVFPGSDGLVRSAEVRAKEATYRRPVTKLCLLEAADEEL